MMKISKEVRIDRISSDGSSVTVLAGNVLLTFLNVNGKPEFVGRGSDAQVYDPSALYVPTKLYSDAWRLAAAVMKEHGEKFRAKSLRESLQYSLRFEA